MKKYVYYALMGLIAFGVVGGGVALAQSQSGSGNGIFHDGRGYERMIETKANILNVSVDELKTQLENNTFPELFDQQGLSHEEFRNQMHEQMEARMTEKLQQLVDNGTITEGQMQERLEFMEQRQAEGGGPHGMGFGKGMKHGPIIDSNGDGVCDHLDYQDDN